MQGHTLPDKQARGMFFIKLGSLLFWSCWFTLVCLTNIFDFMHAYHGLPDNWQFRSGNYALLEKVLEIYHTPPAILFTLFSLDILVQGTSAVLCIISSITFLVNRQITPIINIAFGISMALWAVFILMEEVFIAYGYESVHIRLLAFEMLNLLMLHLLPHHHRTEHKSFFIMHKK
jgi:hypothetical protein